MDQHVSQVSIDDIENTLGQVAEIKAARVVASPEGVIQEVHVLALPNKSPKQLVRDIESTLMATYGLAIDHKKISIAQLGADATISGQPEITVPVDFRARIDSINAHVSGVHATVTVALELAGVRYVGEAAGPASQTGRIRLVALATLDALAQYGDGGHGFALEDVTITQLGRQRVAVSCVTLVSPTGEQSYVGSAVVRQNDNDSIVRATLDAINRRLGSLTTP
ncbi:MAG: hypothetical protein U1E29_12125 [Coriobacteriia bacterium]|nr:hypothetical protein [Coriobacteriia bacterium]